MVQKQAENRNHPHGWHALVNAGKAIPLGLAACPLARLKTVSFGPLPQEAFCGTMSGKNTGKAHGACLKFWLLSGRLCGKDSPIGE
jgi:hypothetical protein